jgi:predicted nucleic acid-binding protein
MSCSVCSRLSRIFEWIAPQLEITARAAEMRARYRLQTPEALEAATASETKATAMVSKDPAFKRVPDFDVLILDDHT